MAKQVFARGITAIVVSSSLLSLGCAAQHMAVTPDLASASEPLPIVDRSAMSGALVDESFKLGPYKVVQVDRKWDSTKSSSIGGYSSSGTTGGYTFGLEGGSAAYKGECASRKETEQVKMFGGTMGNSSYEIFCHCGGPTEASFSMKADTMARYQGTLKTSQASYGLAGIYTNDKGSSVSDPLGYEIRGAEVLGAVEVTGGGRAWMSRAVAAPAREEAACLFAGLLLYKPPQKAFEK